jgi:8-oxo-dGTP pyrophosphatase MutT (NUDIX family)
MVTAEVFVLNERNQVLLVKRKDDGTWCMPGGCQDLAETPSACAVRECMEESGYQIEILDFMGCFSSLNYKFVHYTFKDDVFVHLLFSGRVIGGEAKISDETTAVSWFSLESLPQLLDGHPERLRFAYERVKNPSLPVHFE